MTDSIFQIETTAIGNQDSIESRVAEVDEQEREHFRMALAYLYLDNGPKSIPRNCKAEAELHLSPAEHFVYQWLYKRTDGKLKKLYGPAVLEAVKRSRYRCEKCNFADVRALILEKSGHDAKTNKVRFACLCSNCNTIAAREKEMTALAYEKERAARLAAEKEAAEVAVVEATEADHAEKVED